uniref:DNA cytosine methyltransferase n=1 Tax=Amycolatopsis sp. CA-151526 TaxID=3239921 RepID=UPI003F4960CE
MESIAAQVLGELPEVLTFEAFLKETAAPEAFTYTDIFCGAGGSSIGLSLAGGRLVFAANHWKTAIATHEKNFTWAEHKCADVNNYDMRRLPRTDVLWASPICTEISPAGARKRSKVVQLDMFGNQDEVDREAFVRTRATFHDVIRATEVHRYKAVVVENVPAVATDWELFDWWCDGMKQLGYNVQFVSVNSAHVGGVEAAPQWRDRLYLVFTREGIRLPDVTPRPLAWCPDCEENVNAVQSWRKDDGRGRRIGAYGQQYDYVCPRVERHPGKRRVVEPYVRPAGSAVNWHDLGTPIGERKRRLKPPTMAKIKKAVAMLAAGPVMVTLTHGASSDGRAFPVGAAPLPPRTVTIGEGFVVPPFVTMLRRNGGHHLTTAGPLATMAAGGNHHGLAVPPGGELTLPEAWDRTLVIPYRRGSAPHRVDEPISTVATRTQHGLVHAAADVDLEAVRFRMLKPREQARAQAFPDVYAMTGGPTEQTMQAGNAVSANVARWIGEALAAVL